MVHVRADAPVGGMAEDPGHGGHGGHEGHGTFHHLHGFVTGGRTGRRLYMAHTPVIADPRHSYQVILQGSLPATTAGARSRSSSIPSSSRSKGSV